MNRLFLERVQLCAPSEPAAEIPVPLGYEPFDEGIYVANG